MSSLTSLLYFQTKSNTRVLFINNLNDNYHHILSFFILTAIAGANYHFFTGSFFIYYVLDQITELNLNCVFDYFFKMNYDSNFKNTKE